MDIYIWIYIYGYMYTFVYDIDIMTTRLVSPYMSIHINGYIYMDIYIWIHIYMVQIS